MNKTEREKFIGELVDNVKQDLIRENAKYPDEWNGIQLRERIKNVFGQVVIPGIMTRKQKRDYNNHCLVNGYI